MNRGEKMVIASGRIRMQPATIEAIRADTLPKGNPLVTASVAARLGVRRTAEIIPGHDGHRRSGELDVRFDLLADAVFIECLAPASLATELAIEALTAVSLAALSIYDVSKSLDKTMMIEGVRLAAAAPPASPKDLPCAGDYRPRTGVLVLSDSISAGTSKDRSGAILRDAFLEAGCVVDRFAVIPDDGAALATTIRSWIDDGVELLLTSGGTGLGPRDITVPVLERLFDSRHPGIEQALHARGRESIMTAMLSRLAAGTIGRTIVIALPGSTGAARDAVSVLIPAIFHAYAVREGARHT